MRLAKSTSAARPPIRLPLPLLLSFRRGLARCGAGSVLNLFTEHASISHLP